MTKVAVITGCSTGIGRSVAINLSKSGFKVYATMRNPSDERRAPLEAAGIAGNQILDLDVKSDASVTQAFSYIKEADKKIDVLLLNAGVGHQGVVESTPIGIVEDLFQVNYFGLVRCLQAGIPLVAAAKPGGLIIAISSIVGIRGGPLISHYSATKGAVERLFESEAPILRPLGIHLTIIEPGPVASDFLGHSLRTFENQLPSDDPNAGHYKRVSSGLYKLLQDRFATVQQTTDEVGDLVSSVIKDFNPHHPPPLRIQTSQKVTDDASRFLKDLDGEIARKAGDDVVAKATDIERQIETSESIKWRA